MSSEAAALQLTGSLEDYLETIFELVRDHKLARVKDIAKARGVRSASVTPAMHRLAEMGLIRYQQREYIDLTPAGEREAQRIFAKHQVLTHLLVDVLGMPKETALEDACAMEHSLSPQGMDHIVKFFEYLRVCSGGRELIARYHRCSLVHENAPPCGLSCSAGKLGARNEDLLPLSELRPGQRGDVAQIAGHGAVRQRLLDMGIIPDATLELERVAPTGDPVWIRLHGFQLSLRRYEAASVMVRRVAVG